MCSFNVIYGIFMNVIRGMESGHDIWVFFVLFYPKRLNETAS